MFYVGLDILDNRIAICVLGASPYHGQNRKLAHSNRR
jgi:hypothetical protein